MIKIHFDFTDGTEVSYLEGCKLQDNFTTNCLDFFNTSTPVDDVVVIDRNGNRLSRKLLRTWGGNPYYDKDIMMAHDIQQMLKDDEFNWR